MFLLNGTKVRRSVFSLNWRNTWCAESANASCHLFVWQTETGWSKDAPGILTGCHPFCCCVSWWDLGLNHEQSACNSWPLVPCWEKTAWSNAGRDDTGKDVKWSSSCFATPHAASTTRISAPSYLSWWMATGMKMRHLSCQCRGWCGQRWDPWDGARAGLGCAHCKSNYISII